MPALEFDTLCDIDDHRTQCALECLRQRFLADHDREPQLYDQQDVVDNIINSDLYLHRFLISYYPNENTALDKLKVSECYLYVCECR